MAKNTQTEQTSPQTASAPEKKTPAQWRDDPLADKRAFWEHAVADKLHGWSDHEHHYAQQPLLITQEEYTAALVAGGSFPVVAPVAAALSPLKREQFANFTPREARKQEQV